MKFLIIETKQTNKFYNMMSLSMIIQESKRLHFWPTLLLFILLVDRFQSQCQVCVDVYDCKICYNNCTSVQTQMFQKCESKYCTDGGPSNQFCSQYATKLLNQTECFPQCCAEDVQQFSVQQLNACEANNQKQNTIAIAIGISVSVIVFIIILFLLCWCCRKIGCRCCVCCRREQIYQQESVRQIGSSNNLILIQMQEKNLSSQKWQSQKNGNIMVTNQNDCCAICLSNQVQSLTKCGHYFHLQCILQWFKRNPHCPLCKNKQANNVQYFCRFCFLKYIRIDLCLVRDYRSIIKLIKGPRCRQCQRK